MYMELILTLHSKDSRSSRTLKELSLRPSTRFLSVFLRCLRDKERTNWSSKSHIILLSRTKVKDSVQKAPIAKPAKMKANQISLFQWCNDVWEITNQIIFHTFLKKLRGLWTQLSTVNHRRSFPIFLRGGAAVHRLGKGGNRPKIGIDTEYHAYHPIIPPIVIRIGMTKKIDYVIFC